MAHVRGNYIVTLPLWCSLGGNSVGGAGGIALAEALSFAPCLQHLKCVTVVLVYVCACVAQPLLLVSPRCSIATSPSLFQNRVDDVAAPAFTAALRTNVSLRHISCVSLLQSRMAAP